MNIAAIMIPLRGDILLSMTSTPIRTRFAPSPTGYIHVGNVRAALFPWLLARQQGGAYILRIEDTDQARFVEGATDLILDTLDWLGIDWDEGPRAGGDYGPYFQTERRDIYRAWAQKLIDRHDEIKQGTSHGVACDDRFFPLFGRMLGHIVSYYTSPEHNVRRIKTGCRYSCPRQAFCLSGKARQDEMINLSSGCLERSGDIETRIVDACIFLVLFIL